MLLFFFAFISLQHVSTAQIDQSLVAHWSFDEGSGDTAADEIGSSNATLYNMEDPWIEGYMGNAVDFTSVAIDQDTSKFVYASGEATNLGDQDFSVSVILQADDPFAAGEQSVFSQSNPFIDNGGWYHFSYKDGAMRFMIWDETDLASTSEAALVPASHPVNDYVHIVCVRDAVNKTLSVYLNGDLIETVTDITTGTIATDGNFYMGTVPEFGTQFEGAIDELGVYNIALTAEEIQTLSTDLGFSSLTAEGKDATLADLRIDGTTVTGFNAQTTDYDVVLAEGTATVPTVTFDLSDPEASAVQTDATELPGTTTIEVTSRDETETLTYAINFTVQQPVEPKDILLLGAPDFPADNVTLDSLESWGYSVNFVDGTAFAEEDLSNYTILYVSESIGSGSFAPYDFSIPVFLGEPYALNKTDPLIGEGPTAAAGAQTDFIEEMEILNETHEIMEGVYNEGDIVQVFDNSITINPGASGITDVIQYNFILSDNLLPGTTELGQPAFDGSENEQWEEQPSFVFIDGSILPGGQDIIVHAFHEGASLKGTQDYWTQVKRSVQFLLDDLEPPSVVLNTPEISNAYTLYPNPAKANASVGFTLATSGEVEITLLNLSGQLVKTIETGVFEEGQNTSSFNVSDLDAGIYLVKVKTEKSTATMKLILD